MSLREKNRRFPRISLLKYRGSGPILGLEPVMTPNPLRRMLVAAVFLAASSVAARADDGDRTAALQAQLTDQRVKLTSSAQDYRAAVEEMRASRVPPDRLASVSASLSSLPADLDRYVLLQKDLGRPSQDAALVSALKSEAALAHDVLKTLSARGAAELAASPLPDQPSLRQHTD